LRPSVLNREVSCELVVCDKYIIPTEVAKPISPVMVINKKISMTFSKLEMNDDSKNNLGKLDRSTTDKTYQERNNS